MLSSQKAKTVIAKIKQQQYITEKRAHYAESFKKLGDLEKDEKGKALIEKIRNATSALAAVNNKVITFVLAGNQTEADTFLKGDWEPTYKSLENAFGELSTYQDEQADKTEKEAAAVYQSAIMM